MDVLAAASSMDVSLLFFSCIRAGQFEPGSLRHSSDESNY
jgi:hypothetical protein